MHKLLVSRLQYVHQHVTYYTNKDNFAAGKIQNMVYKVQYAWILKYNFRYSLLANEFDGKCCSELARVRSFRVSLAIHPTMNMTASPQLCACI